MQMLLLLKTFSQKFIKEKLSNNSIQLVKQNIFLHIKQNKNEHFCQKKLYNKIYQISSYSFSFLLYSIHFTLKLNTLKQLQT